MAGERAAWGFSTLGFGVVAFPVSLAIYAAVAFLGILMMGACDHSDNWVCLGLVFWGVFVGVAALALLVPMVIALSSLLLAGGLLVRDRKLYVGVNVAVGVLFGLPGAALVALAILPSYVDLQLQSVTGRLVDVAAGAPLFAIGATCVLAGGVRSAKRALESRV